MERRRRGRARRCAPSWTAQRPCPSSPCSSPWLASPSARYERRGIAAGPRELRAGAVSFGRDDRPHSWSEEEDAGVSCPLDGVSDRGGLHERGRAPGTPPTPHQPVAPVSYGPRHAVRRRETPPGRVALVIHSRRPPEHFLRVLCATASCTRPISPVHRTDREQGARAAPLILTVPRKRFEHALSCRYHRPAALSGLPVAGAPGNRGRRFLWGRSPRLAGPPRVADLRVSPAPRIPRYHKSASTMKAPPNSRPPASGGASSRRPPPKRRAAEFPRVRAGSGAPRRVPDPSMLSSTVSVREPTGARAGSRARTTPPREPARDPLPAEPPPPQECPR